MFVEFGSTRSAGQRADFRNLADLGPGDLCDLTRFRQRSTGRHQHVDLDGTFIERWQEIAFNVVEREPGNRNEESGGNQDGKRQLQAYAYRTVGNPFQESKNKRILLLVFDLARLQFLVQQPVRQDWRQRQ